jgi:hypothetical protein
MAGLDPAIHALDQLVKRLIDPMSSLRGGAAVEAIHLSLNFQQKDGLRRRLKHFTDGH